MHGQRHRCGEEERHRNHVRRVVVKVQELVAHVGYPVEVTENAVREAMAPCAQQDGSDTSYH